MKPIHSFICAGSALLVLALAVFAGTQVNGEQVVKFFATMQTALAYMGLTLPGLAVLMFGGLLAVATLWMFWRANRSPRSENAFDAGQMFQDRNGKTSSTKVMAFSGGMLSLWVVAFLTVSDKLTGEIFGSWLLIIVAGKVSSDAVEKWKGGSGTPTPPDNGEDVAPTRKRGPPAPIAEGK